MKHLFKNKSLAFLMIVTFLFGGVFFTNTGRVLAIESETESVSNQEKLEAALADVDVAIINITANITTTERLTVDHAVIINGNGNTVTFSGNKNWIPNASNYVLQAYVTDVTINDLKLTGGYAALYANGSTVNLKNVDVSGNNVGGIEISKGSGVERAPILNITGTFANDSEAYGKPTVWEDSLNGYIITGRLFTQSSAVVDTQIQYYLDALHTDNTAPTLTSVVHTPSAKTITYTFSEAMQLVNQTSLTATQPTPSLLGIYSIDPTTGTYVNTKVDEITAATLAGNTLTITYAGTLPVGNYIVDAWGYNITDLAGNKIEKSVNQIFAVVAPTPVISYGGGGSSATSYCSTVTYGEWGTNANGIQYRDVLTQTPNSCSLTAEQTSARSRNYLNEISEVAEPTAPIITPETTSTSTQQVLGEKKFADGTLLRGTDNKIYVVMNNTLGHITSLKELAKYAGKTILKTEDSVIASFSKTAVLGAKKYANGTLIKAEDDVKIYVIKAGKKVHVKSLAELRQLKGKTLTVEASELNNY